MCFLFVVPIPYLNLSHGGVCNAATPSVPKQNHHLTTQHRTDMKHLIANMQRQNHQATLHFKKKMNPSSENQVLRKPRFMQSFAIL